MATYLITGATSGLGFQVARRLAEAGGHRLVLPVRDPRKAAALVHGLRGDGRTEIVTPPLDLASLASVADFLKAFEAGADGRLDGLLCNAGVQSADRIEYTVDGIETTFAVNHLAHFFLARGLLDRLAPGARVGWTASGTHDATKASTRLFGFRGARYTSAARLAKADPEPGVSVAQACRDAYATSKLCDIVSARAFAHLHPTTATFFSFDPGLMPGTGLARRQGPVMRGIWHKVLPALASVLPGVSTPIRSSAVLFDLLIGKRVPTCNGAYVDHTGRQLEPAAAAAEHRVAADLTSGSDLLLARWRRCVEADAGVGSASTPVT